MYNMWLGAYSVHSKHSNTKTGSVSNMGKTLMLLTSPFRNLYLGTQHWEVWFSSLVSDHLKKWCSVTELDSNVRHFKYDVAVTTVKYLVFIFQYH